MDPDQHKDDEDKEEDLFSRRDPNEIPSWNPTNVVDYGSKQKKAAEDINETAENILEAFARASRDPDFAVDSRSQHQEREPYLRSQLSNDPYSRSQERDPHFRPPQDRDIYMRPQDHIRSQEPQGRDLYSRSQERDIYDPIRSQEPQGRDLYSRSQERDIYPRSQERDIYDPIRSQEPPGRDQYPRSQERDIYGRSQEPQGRDLYSRSQERDIYDPIRSQERDYRSSDRQSSLERSEYEYRSSRNDYDRDFQNRSYRNPIDEAYHNRKSLMDNFRDNSPGPSKPVQEAPKPQGEVLAVDDLVHPPGRYMRPPKIVIIFRGLPGSGKSFVAKNIKSQESSFGSETPRILALDDYFECDGEVNMQFYLISI